MNLCRFKSIKKFQLFSPSFFSSGPDFPNVENSQKYKSFRPTSENAENTSVILFPGQGSQYVGMGTKLMKIGNVASMFEKAKRILGYDLLNICANGPSSELEKTIYCQPAIFVTSLAAIEKLKEELPGVIESCVGAAGFSIGELTALVFSGALSFEEGLRLVKIRAEVMQKASELAPGGLMTLIYGIDSKINFACLAAREYCLKKGISEEYAICSIANYLFPHCKVIGGHLEALKFIELNAKDFGIKRCKRIHVSAAFHTKLMQPAKFKFKEALNKSCMRLPEIAVYSNLDAKPYTSTTEIVYKLGEQISSPVKWEQIMHTIYERNQQENYPKTFECGPGNSLLTILKLVNFKARLNARHIPA